MDMFGSVVENMYRFVRNGVTPFGIKIGDELQFLTGEDLACGIVRCVDTMALVLLLKVCGSFSSKCQSGSCNVMNLGFAAENYYPGHGSIAEGSKNNLLSRSTMAMRERSLPPSTAADHDLLRRIHGDSIYQSNFSAMA
jgi:hypothetical protein